MEIYKGEKREQYIQQHSIAHLFASPVEKMIEVHEYKRDEWIIWEGQRSEYLFYVMEGKAKIYVTHQNGKASLLNFVHTNEFIGEMELLHEVYYTRGVQAATRTVCLALPFHPCRSELLEDAKFLRELTKVLSVKATIMAEKYSQTLAYPLENRLADFILQTADEGLYREKHVIVCDYLGVSYRHLLHVLAQFCEKGYLEKERRYYLIKDEESLYRLAGMLKN